MFAVLSEVSQALVLHKPLAELLDHVMDLISGHLSMDRGVLMLKEGNPIQLIPKVVRINNKHLQRQKIQVSRSIMDMAFDEQLAVLTSDAALDPRFKGRESIIDSGIHSAMCVPLWNNQEIIGIIYADRISLLQEFTEEDLRLLTLLANLAAVKIENAMLIEQAIEKETHGAGAAAGRPDPEGFPAQVRPPDRPVRHRRAQRLRAVRSAGITTISSPSSPAGSASPSPTSPARASALRSSWPRSGRPSIPRSGRATQIDAMAAKLNDFVQKSSAINAFITFFYGELEHGERDVRLRQRRAQSSVHPGRERGKPVSWRRPASAWGCCPT